VARVSEVLDYFQEPYLVNWKLRVGVKEAKRISQEALAVGTAVDQMVQLDITGPAPDVPKDGPIHNCMKAWQNFKQTDEGKVFFNKAYKFSANMQRELVLGDLTGHPDFIFDDELPDLKTSKSINKSHWMQVAQYAWMEMAYRTINDPPAVDRPSINKISILRLDKNDPDGHYEYQVLEEPFLTFWQGKFQARYEAYKEEAEFHAMMRKVKEREKLQ